MRISFVFVNFVLSFAATRITCQIGDGVLSGSEYFTLAFYVLLLRTTAWYSRSMAELRKSRNGNVYFDRILHPAFYYILEIVIFVVLHIKKLISFWIEFLSKIVPEKKIWDCSHLGEKSFRLNVLYQFMWFDFDYLLLLLRCC